MKRHWIEQMLEGVDAYYIAEVMEAENRSGKGAIGRWRRYVAIAVITVIILGSGISVWAAVSDTFRDWIERTFLGHEISEVEMVQEDMADLPWDEDEHLTLMENMEIHGEKESFVCRYHLESRYRDDGYEYDVSVIDQVYSIQGNGLKKMDTREFQGSYDGVEFGFSYVVINQEIFAFRITGACEQVFHYVDGDIVYATLIETEGEEVVKGCVARLDLKTGSVTKLTDDNRWGNMIMSPNGKLLLMNDRADYYWMVLDLADGTIRRIDELNGYAHTNEVVFKGDYQVISIGDTYMEDSIEMIGIKRIDLQTGKVVASYKNYGEFGIEWLCRQANGKLEMQNVDGTTAVSITMEEGLQGHPHPELGSFRGNYVLLRDLLYPDESAYICNLESGAYMSVHIPDSLEGNVEMYFAVREGKVLLTDGREAYLVTLE